MRGIIYKYTSPSGKVYIGQTRSESTRRAKWFNDKAPYAGPKINAARLKYGPTNFKYEVIFSVEIDDEYELSLLLNKKEREYIELYDSIINGYNLDEGGIYVTLTEEQIKKAGDSHKKAILAYDLFGNFVKEYESSIDASIELGISSGNISQVLNGKRKVAGDYIFTWKTNDNFPRLINTSGKLNRTLVGKYSTDGTLIETYRSITEASKKNNVNRNTLGKYIKNNIDKILGGFIWKEVTNA